MCPKYATFLGDTIIYQLFEEQAFIVLVFRQCSFIGYLESYWMSSVLSTVKIKYDQNANV